MALAPGERDCRRDRREKTEKTIPPFEDLKHKPLYRAYAFPKTGYLNINFTVFCVLSSFKIYKLLLFKEGFYHVQKTTSPIPATSPNP